MRSASSSTPQLRAILIASLLISACGGGGDTPTPATPVTPTNPVVQPGPPASISVQAGDAQVTEPGRAVSVRPAVLVRDAAGVLVPGAAVTFAIDSGGGSVTGSAVTTGADGAATVGEWTLGKEPGRNVLRVSAGSAAVAKIVATSSWTGVTATIGEVGTAGGTITLSRPGSLLDKVALTIPSGALASITHFSVNASASGSVAALTSAQSVNPVVALRGGPALPASMLAVTPIIAIVSDGIPNAAEDVLIKLPIPRGTSSNIIVVIVDSAANPIGYLSPVAQDTTSVTVNTRGLDASVYRLQAPANVAGQRTLSLVVFAGGDALTMRQLYPVAIQSVFQPARDSWGVYDFPTSYFEKPSAGLVLTAWAALGRYANGVWGLGSYAPGVYYSQSPIFMLSAVMAEYVQQYYYTPANLAKWVAYRDANNALYDRWVLTTALAYLRFGATMPLMLTNGTDMRMVLVIGWDPATESLMVLDNAAPGFAVPLAFQNGRMLAYADPWTAGLSYSTPVGALPVASSMAGVLSDGLVRMSQVDEPYVSSWKKTSMRSWGDQIVAGANRTQPDTLFMVDDTTRIWATVQNPSVPVSSSLPVPAGYGVQNSSLFERIGNAWGVAPISTLTSSLFVDARVGSTTNKSLTKTFGFAISAPRSSQSQFTWQAWRQIDVVKFALKVTAPLDIKILVANTYTVSNDGGPALPAGAVYEWNFNDGTSIVKQAGATSIPHTYAEAGTKNIDIKVYHPRTQQLIARTTVAATIGGGFAAWKITNIGVQTNTSGPSPFGPSNGLVGSWDFYNKIFADIRSGVMEGGLIYIPRDTTFDGSFHARGLYVVDGAPLTVSLLNTRLDLPPVGTSYNWRQGFVRGSLLAYAQQQYRASDIPLFDERYAETGTLTAGTISGTSWEWNGTAGNSAQTKFAKFTRSGDVQFLGTTATGTLTYVVRNYTNDFTVAETSRYTLTVTFSAIRIQ